MHLWYIYESMIHLKNLWYIYDRKVTLGFISFVIANPSAWTRLPEPAAQQASQGESGETAQHHGVLGTPWAGWPCDLLHWRCWQYIAAITRLRPQRVDVDSVGMCISCSLGFWHEDSLKFWIVYQCVYYVWMLALVLVQICLDWSLAGVGWDTFFDIIEGLQTDCATCWKKIAARVKKKETERHGSSTKSIGKWIASSPGKTQNPRCLFFLRYWTMNQR